MYTHMRSGVLLRVCFCLWSKNSLSLSQSKGGILSKACDYIRELRQNNQRLQESFKEVERIQVDNELLRQQVNKSLVQIK